MPNISKWTIDLQTNTASFKRGLKGARKQAKGFGTSIRSLVGGPLAKLTAALGFAGGVAGFTYLIKRQMAALDQVAKTSDAIGIQTEKLLGLQHAAGLSGVESDTLTKSLIRMQRSIGDATDGLTTSIRAFDKLGLNFRDLASMSPDEQLAKIADAMDNVATQTERVAIVMQIFGRGGASLIPLLNEGSAGIKAMVQEVKDLGGAFTRIDLAKVEAANNSFRRMKLLSTIAIQTITVQLAPILDAAAMKFFEMGKSGEGMGKKIVRSFEWITKGIAFMADMLNELRKLWEGVKITLMLGLREVAKGFKFLVQTLQTSLGFLANQIADTVELMPGIGKSFAAAIRFANQAIQMKGQNFIAGLDKDILSITDDIDGMVDAIQQLENASWGKAVTRFFEDLRRKADNAARSIANAAGQKHTPGGAPTPGASTRPGTFEQLVRGGYAANIAAGPTPRESQRAGRAEDATRRDKRKLTVLEEINRQLQIMAGGEGGFWGPIANYP